MLNDNTSRLVEILVLAIPLGGILSFLVFITTEGRLEQNYEILTVLSYDLRKKENVVNLYSHGLKQCYNKQSSSDCSNIEEKLLGLKADYNAFAMDYNKVSKEFKWKSYDNSKKLPILYEMK